MLGEALAPLADGILVTVELPVNRAIAEVLVGEQDDPCPEGLALRCGRAARQGPEELALLLGQLDPGRLAARPQDREFLDESRFPCRYRGLQSTLRNRRCNG